MEMVVNEKRLMVRGSRNPLRRGSLGGDIVEATPQLLQNSFAMDVVVVSHVLPIHRVQSRGADMKRAWPASASRPIRGASEATARPVTSRQHRRRGIIAWWSSRAGTCGCCVRLSALRSHGTIGRYKSKAKHPGTHSAWSPMGYVSGERCPGVSPMFEGSRTVGGSRVGSVLVHRCLIVDRVFLTLSAPRPVSPAYS